MLSLPVSDHDRFGLREHGARGIGWSGSGGFKGKNVGYGSLERKVQEMGLSGEAEQLQGE